MQEDIIKKIHAQARRLGACQLFKGSETLEEIIDLFLSPQGQEFCVKNRFPNIATVRLFKGMGVEKHGIYIDAGVLTLKNPSKAVLIGRTSATVNCDTLEQHEVILMHGAKATVNAQKWAVVKVTCGDGSSVIRNVFNNAIIL